MAIQEKLLTHDRIKKWGCYDLMVCSLYKQDSESHDLLFFKCKFSQVIWKHMHNMMDYPVHEVEWCRIINNLAEKPCSNIIWSVIRRLCLGATIYFLLQERNFRIFKDEDRNWQTIFKIICDNVKTRIMGLRVK